ncbi:hypothetical protein CI612_11830 [Klebsiella quasipneumoniae subsp. similipneumoniae]|nr:hypothetical protein CI612_11830 [Klebsiella quasipneumoniae subsp. similipneumoniae]
MMSLWDALRMNMMISYQELVRTFPSFQVQCLARATACPGPLQQITLWRAGGRRAALRRR